MLKKSVITLAAYDAHLLPRSIKSYYAYVDEIILGLDKDRISWSGNNFSFDETKLWQELKAIDFDKKISIIEENFHPGSVAIENDTYERNFLKEQCSNDFILSFDADEVLVNPYDFFIEYLPLAEPYIDKKDLLFTWFHPYKIINDEVLYIANEDGSFCHTDTQDFATKKDKTFTYCRWTNEKRYLHTPLAVLHWSFCRNNEQLEEKISNYGHSDKAANDPFYENRKKITLENYTQLRNFKTSNMGDQWPKLEKIHGTLLMDKAKKDAERIY